MKSKFTGWLDEEPHHLGPDQYLRCEDCGGRLAIGETKTPEHGCIIVCHSCKTGRYFNSPLSACEVLNEEGIAKTMRRLDGKMAAAAAQSGGAA